MAVLGTTRPAAAEPRDAASKREKNTHSSKATHNFAIRLLATETTRDAWIARQLAYANDRYAAVGIAFHLEAKEKLDAAYRILDGAQARDRVGREAVRRGEILWVVPERLVDLDGSTRRRGVHWRDRADARSEDQRRRWVIVTVDADPFVLAHELGHFFGLPHSTEAASFMNKTPGPRRPPPAARRLTARERRRVLARTRAMVRSGRLEDRSKPGPSQ